MQPIPRRLPQTYRAAGVDIEAAEKIVQRIKRSARSTFSSDVLSDIGSFGGFYNARFRSYKKPVLVSSIDGVGTKVKVAQQMGEHTSIGEDLVNHCVNDILVCGALPLFFLDYIGMGRLSPTIVASILGGIVKACKENNCSLIGGETAEMPGVYRKGDYDLVGTIIGVAEKEQLLDGRKVQAGDQLIALPSTGLHTNGYSLARKVLFRRLNVSAFVDELGTTLGTALLAVHRSYMKPIQSLSGVLDVHAMSHVTGGGIVGNTKRILRRGLAARIDWNSWKRPPIFDLIQKLGRVPETDMRRTFNLGVGLVVIVGRHDVGRAVRRLRRIGETPFVIGHIEKS